MAINAADRLIVALDVSPDMENPDRQITIEDARKIIKNLDGVVSFIKIGWPLYMVSGGPDLVSEFIEQGKRVFLDLKYGDIPEAVKRLITSAVEKHVDFLTVTNSARIVKAAVEGRGKSKLKVLMVTILTATNESDLREFGIQIPLQDYVKQLAMLGKDAGCDGLICSGRDVSMLRKEVGDELLLVSPGIRPTGFDPEDHKRPTTPEAAIKNGADFLVMGRPIVRAKDPRSMAMRVIDEMQKAFDFN